MWNHLEPGESLAEVLFGLIMVLTFTLGAGLTTADLEGGSRQLLIATLGCNLAWGIIDGVMYGMNAIFDRGRAARIRLELQRAGEAGALALIAREFEPKLLGVTSVEERSRFYREVLTVVSRKPVSRTRVQRGDVYGGIACFVLVFVTALPAAVPFMVIDNARLALRVSNALLVAMLFGVGYWWAGHTLASRIGTGLTMMFIGVALVLAAIALGG